MFSKISRFARLKCRRRICLIIKNTFRKYNLNELESLDFELLKNYLVHIYLLQFAGILALVKIVLTTQPFYGIPAKNIMYTVRNRK